MIRLAKFERISQNSNVCKDKVGTPLFVRIRSEFACL